MDHNKKLGVRFKLIVLSLISLLGMLLSLLIYMHSIGTNLYAEKKAQTKKSIESAMGIMKYFHSLDIAGEMAGSEAQRLAMASLASALYGETGYFWINDTKGVMLMNPNTPHLEGRLVINDSDVNGKYPFREFIKAAQAGGGWVEYNWPKPRGTQSQRKISYVALFRPWGWVLGTGLYLDDMEREIRSTAISGAVTIVVIFSILIVVSIVLSNRFMKQLKNVAIHDPLTSLFTRRFMLESIPIFLSKHDRTVDHYLSVAFFDIDHFKSVNDRHGHACGDRVLAGIGKTIRNVVRKGDLGIRYGGEEFVVVMMCSRTDDAIAIAERIRELSHQMLFQCGDQEFSVTLSAGVSFRVRGEEFESVLQRADENLYRAKNKGRDRLVSE